MNYDKILNFKGTWRTYQARVLENAMKYLDDGRVHIVAAPGSGKTTLGIELIKRLATPALVLAPSITIREQWIARIKEAFLNDGLNADNYLSQDLKEPRVITVVTYQSLHSAITRFKGNDSSESTDDDNIEDIPKNEVDYSDFDIFSMIKDNSIGVLCLDECHHLRTEWWKALEEIKKQCGNLKVIALTATPPYDSTPSLWKRYIDMCGEIDEEITIPELVKEGSLCPHQDFIYFNYPTNEELSENRNNKELVTSKGKTDSIKEIVTHEYQTLGNELRLLILTDYIKKDYINAIGDTTKEVNELGVVPFFEMLRREFNTTPLKLAVLCGTLVIIPSSAREALEKEIGTNERVTFSPIGVLSEAEYVQVKAVGDSHFLTGAVTNIFTAGHMQVLVGTKSLLGEGWDSPCINSLILASFVGSFMLSNQMRGRAIRKFKNKPDKTSNIWHLVCLTPAPNAIERLADLNTISEDLALLMRRMEHFHGLHYEKNTIENGIERLSVIKPILKGKYSEKIIAEINNATLALSDQRDTLAQKWQNALTIYTSPKLNENADDSPLRKKRKNTDKSDNEKKYTNPKQTT